VGWKLEDDIVICLLWGSVLECSGLIKYLVR